MQDANTLPWTEPQARAETVARAGWSAPVLADQAFAAKVGPRGTAVAAFANHGRWVVECPDCCQAVYACPDDPRFMCNNCANAMNGGLWRPVIWPKGKDIIDRLLDARPDPTTRNWSPGEPLKQLKDENKANGVSA